jgi:tRNA U34 5-methylaminomethyl-2-thiouridine-forming methyltransferase MnmC
LYVPELDEHYHSYHGSIKESQRVFIDLGLNYVADKVDSISILEVGMGTGLNVLMTALANEGLKKSIRYDAIEAFPLEDELLIQLNYGEQLIHPTASELFESIHLATWNEGVQLTDLITLTKIEAPVEAIDFSPEQYDLIYFDAFAPEVQGELWTAELFSKMYSILKPGGVLSTYCVKGDVKRALQAQGFTVEKHKGPEGGKREVLRAVK